MRRWAWLLALVATSTWAAERFAVVVGNDAGSGRRPQLWFAEKDAERFARTLVELGEFPADAVTLLRGRGDAEVREALRRTEERVQAARREGRRTVFVFYFSGHAGEGALELGRERLEFPELKALVESSSSDVKVAIVDACESGALTQVKGARASVGVDFLLPTEESARGTAWIASTAVGEVAQESASIGGSFFSIHLDAALRGAGDANGDGQVSLAEAFQYTSAHTVIGTSATDVGPQHPTYDFKMSGRGDVVLADLRKAEARLELPATPRATWIVWQEKRVVAELEGGVIIAVPAGTYRVERRIGREAAAGTVTVGRGERRSPGELTPVVLAARGKGGSPATASVFAGASLGAPVMAGLNLLPGLRLGGRVALGRWGLRFVAGYGNADGVLPTTARFRLQSVSAELALLRRLVDQAWWLDVGVEGGGAWHLETFDQAPERSALSGSASATVAAGWRLLDGVVVPQLQLSGGARVFQLNGAPVVRPLLTGALVVGVEF